MIDAVQMWFENRRSDATNGYRAIVAVEPPTIRPFCSLFSTSKKKSKKLLLLVCPSTANPARHTKPKDKNTARILLAEDLGQIQLISNHILPGGKSVSCIRPTPSNAAIFFRFAADDTVS